MTTACIVVDLKIADVSPTYKVVITSERYLSDERCLTLTVSPLLIVPSAALQIPFSFISYSPFSIRIGRVSLFPEKETTTCSDFIVELSGTSVKLVNFIAAKETQASSKLDVESLLRLYDEAPKPRRTKRICLKYLLSAG